MLVDFHQQHSILKSFSFFECECVLCALLFVLTLFNTPDASWTSITIHVSYSRCCLLVSSFFLYIRVLHISLKNCFILFKCISWCLKNVSAFESSVRCATHAIWKMAREIICGNTKRHNDMMARTNEYNKPFGLEHETEVARMSANITITHTPPLNSAEQAKKKNREKKMSIRDMNFILSNV